MLIENQKFCSKILLFGEYSIIYGSQAIAIPYNLFSGNLSFSRQVDYKDRESNIELKGLFDYLKSLESSTDEDMQFIHKFDLRNFEFDLGQGLYFESSIPQGYGLGSSGALTAAIASQYANISNEIAEGNHPYSILELKKILSAIEGHFHGKSSGIDPLISFLQKPLLMKGQDDLRPVATPLFHKRGGGIFLLNTNRSRRTEPLVHLFMEKYKNPDFFKVFNEELIPSTNKCIESFLNTEVDNLLGHVKTLSTIQREHFLPMIPKSFHAIWKKGLESDAFYLKLCGAGGGGFILGFTPNFEKTKELLKDYQFRTLFEF